MGFDVDVEALRRSDSLKWASTPSDVTAAWIADMDFGVPEPVIDAISSRTQRGELGYPKYLLAGNPLIDVFEQRMSERFQWTPRPGRTTVVTNVIQPVSIAVHHLTQPGDAIALHVPAYNMFLQLFHDAGRRIVPIEMTAQDGAWAPDSADLARTWRDAGVRLVVLVNPHNPTGHVFTRAELTTLADAAAELDLPVISDEIHSDLILDRVPHIPFASLSDDAARRTITVTSASKAFNLAALHCAVAHIGHDGLWSAFESVPFDYFGAVSALSVGAHVAAWTICDDWNASLLDELRDRRGTLQRWCLDQGVGFIEHQATYLAWLDFGATSIANDPAGELLERARVRVSPGSDYTQATGIDGSQFVRYNFATDAPLVTDTLERMGQVL